jgi:hypothetical protein
MISVESILIVLCEKCEQLDVDTYIRTYMHTRRYILAILCVPCEELIIRTYIHTYIHTGKHYTCIHTHNTYIHTFTHIYTHTHRFQCGIMLWSIWCLYWLPFVRSYEELVIARFCVSFLGASFVGTSVSHFFVFLYA